MSPMHPRPSARLTAARSRVSAHARIARIVAVLSGEVSQTIDQIKGKVIDMQVKCEKGVAVTLLEANNLYEDCLNLYYTLAKVFKYTEIEPGEPDQEWQIFKDWLSKMKLERFLAQFEERNWADLHILIKMGSHKVYEDAALFMLNYYTNLLYFDGNEHSFRVVSSELPAWLKD
ncbi:MAG: hypothetical protein SGPRY_007741 [Prymnesium sp.]